MYAFTVTQARTAWRSCTLLKCNVQTEWLATAYVTLHCTRSPRDCNHQRNHVEKLPHDFRLAYAEGAQQEFSKRHRGDYSTPVALLTQLTSCLLIYYTC